MNSIAVGLASGLGNCVHMLPAIKALSLMGHSVSAFVQTDFPTASLWRRCGYLDSVMEPPASLNGHQPVCGNWRPPAWATLQNVKQVRLPSIHAGEWRSNFRLAQELGWQGGAPDISDWCRDLDRAPRWDIGIVPGSKGGIWLRKRYPGMAAVAGHFAAQGLKVAVFGQDGDGVADIPGERVATPRIELLPDALAGCRIVIGTDSGLTFLASSLGVPVVMIYTATSEIKAAPVRPHRAVAASLPCHPCVSTPRWQRCADWRCQQIEPANVIAAAEELLTRDIGGRELLMGSHQIAKGA